jgi:hypothetical protein
MPGQPTLISRRVYQNEEIVFVGDPSVGFKDGVKKLSRYGNESEVYNALECLLSACREYVIVHGMVEFVRNVFEVSIEPSHMMMMGICYSGDMFYDHFLNPVCPVCVYPDRLHARAVSPEYEYIATRTKPVPLAFGRDMNDQIILWGRHDECPSRCDYNWFIHETMTWDHFHYRVFTSFDRTYRFHGIRGINRLELELMQGAYNILTSFKDQSGSDALSMKRFCPFPLPLSRVKPHISSQIQRLVESCMWMMSTLTLPFGIVCLGDLFTMEVDPLYTEKLWSDVIYIKRNMNIRDVMGGYTTEEIDFHVVEEDVVL